MFRSRTGRATTPPTSRSGDDAQVRVTGLRKTYGKTGEVVALDDLDLSIQDGEMLVLLGPSGCGKTTTLRSVAGLLQPTAGRIEMGGRTVFDSQARVDVPTHDRNFGMVFQTYALWPHKSVAGNVRYPLLARKVPKAQHSQLVQAVLRTVQCEHLADRFPHQLSGGQQQRVALARALVGDPALLLLDEPLSNLDAMLRIELRTELRSLHREIGFTAIHVTHDQAEALGLATRLVVMRDGRIEQDASPEVVYDQPATTYVAEFLGVRNSLDLTRSNGRWRSPLGEIPETIPAPADVDRVQLLSRPEWLRLAPAVRGDEPIGDGMVTLGRARVAEALFGGLTSDFVAVADDVTLHVSQPRAFGRVDVGQEVTVGLVPDAGLLYRDGALIATTPSAATNGAASQ